MALAAVAAFDGYAADAGICSFCWAFPVWMLVWPVRVCVLSSGVW